MRMRGFAIFLAITLLLLAGAASGENLSATAVIEPSSVYLSEAATLRITVTGANSDPAAQIPAIDGLAIAGAGVSHSTSQSITIINGQMSQQSQTTYYLNYRVTPARGGSFHIPEISVSADGQTVQTAALNLNVTSPGSDDRAWMEVEVRPNPVVIGDDFTVTFKLYLEKLTYQNQVLGIEPFVARQPPALSIPWFESLSNTETKDFRSFASGYVGNPGFTINGYAQEDFFSRKLITFRLPREETTHQGKPYFVYRIDKTFRAVKPGDVEISPCTLKGSLIDQIVGPNEGTQKNVYQASNAITLRITDPPEQGRPAEWSGAIGQFDARADAAPTQINLGDPVTLTLTVHGDGLWSTVDAPDLGKQDEFIRNFKLHDRTVQGEETSDGKIFRYTIRPIQSDIQAVPAVRFAFYNPKRKSYVSIKTAPIPIQIRSTEKVRLEEVVEAEAKKAAPEMREVVEGLYANESNPDRLLSIHGASGGWAGWAMTPILFMVAGAITFTRSRRDMKRERARRAAGDFQAILRQLARGQDISDDRFVSSILSAASIFVSMRLDLSITSLTPPEMIRHLQDCGVSSAAIDRLKKVFTDLEGFRYGRAQAVDRQIVAEEMIHVVGDIDGEARQAT